MCIDIHCTATKFVFSVSTLDVLSRIKSTMPLHFYNYALPRATIASNLWTLIKLTLYSKVLSAASERY